MPLVQRRRTYEEGKLLGCLWWN